jgi:hypothetical protein
VRTFKRISSAAQLKPKLEQGADALDGKRPADILLPNFTESGTDAALDFTIVSPLKLDELAGAGASGNRGMYAVAIAEKQKIKNNEEECEELGWECVPMAVNLYGVWGEKAKEVFKKVAHSLSFQMNMSMSVASAFVYNVMGVVLARKNARALIACLPHTDFGGAEVGVVGGVDLSLDEEVPLAADSRCPVSVPVQVDQDRVVDLPLNDESELALNDESGVLSAFLGNDENSVECPQSPAPVVVSASRLVAFSPFPFISSVFRPITVINDSSSSSFSPAPSPPSSSDNNNNEAPSAAADSPSVEDALICCDICSSNVD